MGRLAGIARRDRKRAPMETLECAEISLETGVAMDFRGKPGPRQVTVISASAWREACRELKHDLPWTTRRANLLVDGFELPRTIGAVLRVGPVRLCVTGEVDPCSRMDEECPGLRLVLQPDWRGGVSCAVLQGGAVAIGDEVALEPADTNNG
jgi:MOSC domain-containing protein YiiM